MWELKNKTDEQTKSRTRPINTENKLKVARGEGRGVSKKGEENGRYRLLIME